MTTRSKTIPPRLHCAKTFFDRLTGIMGKKRWPFRWNGVFFPECRSVHTFFTYLEPDILFLDKRCKILRIFQSAKPWRIWMGPSGSWGCVECPAGTAKRMKWRKGIRFQWKEI
jgi:uncharacterized protein